MECPFVMVELVSSGEGEAAYAFHVIRIKNTLFKYSCSLEWIKAYSK